MPAHFETFPSELIKLKFEQQYTNFIVKKNIQFNNNWDTQNFHQENNRTDENWYKKNFLTFCKAYWTVILLIKCIL